MNDCNIGICSTFEVEAYFKQYRDYARNLCNDDWDQIIDYFEDTYIGRFRGHPAPPVRGQYFDANQRLIRILDNFPNLDAMQYLKSIAYNLGLY